MGGGFGGSSANAADASPAARSEKAMMRRYRVARVMDEPPRADLQVFCQTTRADANGAPDPDPAGGGAVPRTGAPRPRERSREAGPGRAKPAARAARRGW